MLVLSSGHTYMKNVQIRISVKLSMELKFGESDLCCKKKCFRTVDTVGERKQGFFIMIVLEAYHGQGCRAGSCFSLEAKKAQKSTSHGTV